MAKIYVKPNYKSINLKPKRQTIESILNYSKSVKSVKTESNQYWIFDLN